MVCESGNAKAGHVSEHEIKEANLHSSSGGTHTRTGHAAIGAGR